MLHEQGTPNDIHSFMPETSYNHYSSTDHLETLAFHKICAEIQAIVVRPFAGPQCRQTIGDGLAEKKVVLSRYNLAGTSIP